MCLCVRVSRKKSVLRVRVVLVEQEWLCVRVEKCVLCVRVSIKSVFVV